MRFLTECESMPAAQEYQMSLEEQGIKSVIKEKVLASDAFSGGMPGQEVDLLVEDEDYDKALSVIGSMSKKKTETKPWCPKCGEEDVERMTVFPKHGPYWVLILCLFFVAVIIFAGIFVVSATYFMSICNIIAIAFLGVTLYYWFRPSKRERYKCNKCGHEFNRY